MKTFLFLIVFLFSVSNSFSAVRTWDGGGADANWATAANWVGDVAPVVGDSLIFPAMAAQFSTTNNLSSFTFSSVTIEGGNYTISGSALRITGGLTVNGGNQALNTFVELTSSQTFSTAQNSTVTIGLLFIASSFSNPFVVTLDGAGSFFIGVITGTGSLTKTGAGASLIAAAGNYDGAVTLNQGVLVVDANIPQSTVTINSGTIGGTDFFGLSGFGGTGTVGATNVTAGVISAGTLDSPTGILNISNGLTFTANGNYVCKIGGTAAGTNGHDQLNVTGTVSLNNARLVPLPFNTFRPAIGDQFVILRNDGTDPINGKFLNAPEGAVFAGALNTAFRITYQGGDGNDVVITRVNRANFDFDGDGKSDISVFRPNNRVWYVTNSSNNSFRAEQFGLSTDRITPADYDGDNKTDISVFRNGVWYRLNSSDGIFNAVQFGVIGDIPVPADFDGDGRADIAIYRPSTGTWWSISSINNAVSAQQFGIAEDKPAFGDYDGDGRTDIAVYRPSNGVWHILQSSDNLYRAERFGISEDKPVTGDYDGDGKNDLAVFRPSTSVWYILRSSNGSFSALQFGLTNDIPTPGDFDGDGKTDITVYRNGVWYVLNISNGNVTVTQFGSNGDIPTPYAFVY
ncbi:MAG: VCBS repeat-containing protein [Pyrinomonadaceae bacterium]|nr:VCBS repeat-containing protein [Pyrinomonadaceae bacterium]